MKSKFSVRFTHRGSNLSGDNSDVKKKEKKVSKEDQQKFKLFDELLYEEANFRCMKDSLIYNSESSDVNNLKIFAKMMSNKNENMKQNSKGFIPCPRDGHSSIISDNKLIIFGGDRDKLSYCDLYYFDINGYNEQKNDKNYFVYSSY